MSTFLDEPGLIDNPSRHWSGFLHCWKNVFSHLLQHLGIAPSRLGDEVMHGLVHDLHTIGRQARCHGFNAFAFTVQQQPGTVIQQRNFAVRMSYGLRQPIKICRKTFLLCCWRQVSRSHENIITQICFL
jgi:hypothetical protein